MSQKDLVKAIQSSDESIFNQIVSDGKNTSLEGESFKNSQIGAMRIHTINMANTEWEACLFDGTTFENVDLEGAFFNGCTFHDCHFIHIANFSDTAFDGCVWKNSEIADPQGDEDGKIECLEISNCQFRDCILRNIQFAESTLQSLSFSGGKIENISGDAEVKSVALRNAEVEKFDTSEMTLSNCTASGCTNVPKGFVLSAGKRCRV